MPGNLNKSLKNLSLRPNPKFICGGQIILHCSRSGLKTCRVTSVLVTGSVASLTIFKQERVRTSKIRTSKGQNIESIFRMIRALKDQNVENQNIEKNVESHFLTFNVLIFLNI